MAAAAAATGGTRLTALVRAINLSHDLITNSRSEQWQEWLT
jgi:hypothetical protein